MTLQTSWQQIWQQNCRSLTELFQICAINSDDVDLTPEFPINIPRRIVEKIKSSSDPLFLQFVPLKKEKTACTGFSKDPLNEQASFCTPNLLQKYEGRALLITTQTCCMHCRFCFRQHFPYHQSNLSEEVQWIASHKEIQEVILSGGDPLSLTNKKLFELLSSLEKIPHLQRVRFHTRFPIGIPERIDEELLHFLSRYSKQLLFVIHVNHPRELDVDVQCALKKCMKLGIPVLSQTVLLHRVNDSLSVLKELFTELSNIGVIPYYLHQLDPVQGVSHFHVPIEKGKRLIEKLRSELSGYMIPRFAQEIPGKTAKTVLM